MTLIAEKTNVTTPVHNVINNKEETMLPFDSNILSFKDFHQAIVHFRNYHADKANRPTYDTRYGTKYPGKLKHIHYAFYAILRGKPAEITTHDENSESYIDVCEIFSSIRDGRTPRGCALLAEAFGLSAEQIRHVLVTRKNEK